MVTIQCICSASGSANSLKPREAASHFCDFTEKAPVPGLSPFTEKPAFKFSFLRSSSSILGMCNMPVKTRTAAINQEQKANTKVQPHGKNCASHWGHYAKPEERQVSPLYQLPLLARKSVLRSRLMSRSQAWTRPKRLLRYYRIP